MDSGGLVDSMMRRIFAAALGGIVGVGLMFAGLAALHALGAFLFIARLWPIWLFIAVGCGGFTMWVGEKLRIVPSTEELNRKLGPVRLFDERS
jgi:hypothetical protein